MNDNYNEDEYPHTSVRRNYPPRLRSRWNRTAPYPRWSPFVSNYRDHNGVWIVYDYDSIPYVIMLFEDVVPAAKFASQNGYGRVAFWPFEMKLQEGIDWWNEKNKEPEPDEEYEHFHWADDGTAFCVNDGVGAVDFEFEDSTKLCPKCLDKVYKHMQGE